MLSPYRPDIICSPSKKNELFLLEDFTDEDKLNILKHYKILDGDLSLFISEIIDINLHFFLQPYSRKYHMSLQSSHKQKPANYLESILQPYTPTRPSIHSYDNPFWNFFIPTTEQTNDDVISDYGNLKLSLIEYALASSYYSLHQKPALSIRKCFQYGKVFSKADKEANLSNEIARAAQTLGNFPFLANDSKSNHNKNKKFNFLAKTILRNIHSTGSKKKSPYSEYYINDPASIYQVSDFNNFFNIICRSIVPLAESSQSIESYYNQALLESITNIQLMQTFLDHLSKSDHIDRDIDKMQDFIKLLAILPLPRLRLLMVKHCVQLELGNTQSWEEVARDAKTLLSHLIFDFLPSLDSAFQKIFIFLAQENPNLIEQLGKELLLLPSEASCANLFYNFPEDDLLSSFSPLVEKTSTGIKDKYNHINFIMPFLKAYNYFTDDPFIFSDLRKNPDHWKLYKFDPKNIVACVPIKK